MADLDLQLTREFFELHGFTTFTHWKQTQPRSKRGDSGVQLFIENIHPSGEAPEGLVLNAGELAGIHRAVAEIRAWHTDRFYAATVESNPIVAHFAQPHSLVAARDHFGTDDFRTILIISELAASPQRRAEAIEAFRAAGLSHVIEFPTVLRGIADKISVSGPVAPTATLQIMQILKRYRLFRDLQMEFLFPFDAPPSVSQPRVDTMAATDDGEDD